jgi:hypothetical protein
MKKKGEGNDFGWRPFSANLEDDMEIKAKAGCNIHGSAGETAIRVMVKE